MPFADEYVVSAHPPLPLHSKVPRPWALDTYSTVILCDEGSPGEVGSVYNNAL